MLPVPGRAAAAFANLASSGISDVHEAMVEAHAPKAAVRLLGCCDVSGGTERTHSPPPKPRPPWLLFSASAPWLLFSAPLTNGKLRACTTVRAARFCIGVFVHMVQDAQHGEEARDAFLRAGFVDATCKLLLSAPPAAPAAAAAVEEACRAFAGLAFADAEGRGVLRESDARRALTAAVDRFPREMKLQEMGRALLAEMEGDIRGMKPRYGVR